MGGAVKVCKQNYMKTCWHIVLEEWEGMVVGQQNCAKNQHDNYNDNENDGFVCVWVGDLDENVIK